MESILRGIYESEKIDYVGISKKFKNDLVDMDMGSEDTINMMAEIIAQNKRHVYHILAGKLIEYYIDNKVGDMEDSIKILENVGGLHDEVIKFYYKNKEKIEEKIKNTKIYDLTFFAARDYLKKYLRRVKGEICTNIKQLFMIVSMGLTYKDGSVEDCLTMFEILSKGKATFGSPTLFNSGKPRPQMSSCFLFTVGDDLSDIYMKKHDMAMVSKNQGGIGFNITGVRSKGRPIGVDGKSEGVVPLLKTYNKDSDYCNQSGKRKSAWACYVEPWHADIFDILDLKKNTGSESDRARSLFYAMWINDLFMARIRDDQIWSLFSPDKCKDLVDLYGEEFNKKYSEYEDKKMFERQVKARTLWDKILSLQIETGVPYILYKDAANRKSNQKNIGTIRCSNLCAEIIQYSDKNESAVCNLSSISLPAFVSNGTFDFSSFSSTVRFVIKMLNNVIDINYYPIQSAEESNKKHRPVGLGLQGMADLFLALNIGYTSDDARHLNRKIYEYLYFNALVASNELAMKYGPYSSFSSSPLSEGLFQFDLWRIEHESLKSAYKDLPHQLQTTFNNKFIFDESKSSLPWDNLRSLIKKFGVRNSLLIAQMPTASCITTDSTIRTQNGNTTIRTLLENNSIDIDRIHDTSSSGWFNFPQPIYISTRYGPSKSYRAFYSGKQPIFKLTFDDGHVLRASYNHRLLVKSPSGTEWKYITEISPSDEIISF